MATHKAADWTCDYFVENRTSCKNSLANINESGGIPSLNSSALHDLKDGQLVRFRGMIQDMYNPEFYFERYEVRDNSSGESSMRTGMYRDTALCQEHEDILLESENNKSSERQTFVVISVPGLNEWAKEKCQNYAQAVDQSPRLSSKRPLDQDDEEPMDTSEPAKKKEREESNVNQVGKESSLPENLLNFPISIKNGRACIVKVYEEDASFKLNQVVDVVGFISLDPTVHTICDPEEFTDDAEIRAHNPPASLIPRLHAIAITQSSEDLPVESSLRLLPSVGAVRSDLHKVFSQILFGDDLAADFLIAHLLSKIYMRRNDLCLGNYPLNITHFSVEKFPNFPKSFYNLLTEIVSKSHYFLCTLDNLNDGCLIPKKDYECNRLTSGTLQLSNNTHLVIDETKLTAGKLSQEGRKNYQAIDNLLTLQKVTYDFKFYTMEYEMDIPVLILSETKSFLPCMVQVPLNIDSDIENRYPQVLQLVEQFLKDEDRLNDVRKYFKQLQLLDFQIDQAIADTIQEDFVKLRQLDDKINADNLHSLMVLARLMALSHGESSLTLERWRDTFKKELERLARLRKRAK
ncbi:mini-chromosome maintenance complex-binding protein [Diachasma alloeum]|uniref:mini-chromosome maintenance complex-binding protein n=1 Tax=Diachasma alloeum TaxID=454923 RepID=UPI0007384D84|nr:mini-chromosome maintenance complex-binding protein [Diachasma alloeum]